jgi:hypothetical protein
VHEVVEADAVLEKVVETTEDAEDTEREDVDTDNSDNGRVAADEPTEQAEEGGDQVDADNGASKLPRRNTAPEGSIGTGDEDEPILGERDFQEDNLVADTKVLDDTSIDALSDLKRAGRVAVREHGGEGNPSTNGKDNTEQNGHTPEPGKVPLDRSLREGSVVVGNGQSGDIGENGNENDKLKIEGLVKNGDPQTQEDFQMKRKGDTVDDVGVHTMENLAGSLESVNDGRETRSQEDNIGGGTGGVRSTFDSDTSISLLKRRSIVHTITSHGYEVATLLENFDDIVLVLWEHLGETICSFDEIVDFGTGHFTATTETKTLGVVDVGTKTELAGGFTSNADGIASQHLDGETKGLGFVDGAVGVVTWRIRAGHDSENLPGGIATLASDTERAETTGSELGNLVLVGLINLGRDWVVFLDSLQDEKRSALDADDALALRRLNDGLNLLGDGIKGVEVDDLVLGEYSLSAWVELEGLEESLVNGINTLLLARGSQAGSKHEIIGLDTSDGEGLGERQLVLGEGTSLVGAENLDTGKGLNSGKLLYDGLLLGEVRSTDGHGGGDDGRKTDRHTDNGDGKSELEDFDDAVGSVERRDPDNEQSHDDENQQDCTDAVQDLGEMTGSARGRGDKGGGTSDEGAITSSIDDHEGLTTLDGRGSVASISSVLVNGKRLAGDGGLINLEEGVFGDNATISGNDGTFFDLENISRNDLGGFDFLELAVTKNGGLEGESLLQFLDNGSSLVFLDETDSGIEQQKSADDTEIDPILKTGSEDGSGL